MLSFKLFLEFDDPITGAILGVLSGDEGLGPEEQQHLFQRRTSDFSTAILDRLRNLGVIKAIETDDRTRYYDVLQSISRGISIAELIEMVKGQNYSQNALIKPE